MHLLRREELRDYRVSRGGYQRTNKWLAEQIGVDQATVFKWCTNSAQPNLENLMEVAKCLEVNVNELLRMSQRLKQLVIERRRISDCKGEFCL